MNAAGPVLAVTGVVKNYSALRPLRIRALTINEAERVAILGLDAPAAELVINLVTGASLPDEGQIEVLGQRTAEIADGDAWLSSLDRFGIVSNRAVMMDGATLAQNLAMPFTLDIDPIPPEIRSRVEALAAECGIAGKRSAWLDRPAGEASPEVRMRGHLARAVAFAPRLLLFEHPTAIVPEAERDAFADDVVAVATRRGLAALVMTQDRAFAARVGERVMTLDGATGEMAPSRRKWFW
jgi:predicted ABC-type transport system involved in lysophospholipase L1 biosynthesis ATPase subunit